MTGRQPTLGVSVRVLGYARVSTDEQAASGAGMSAQKSAIRESCAREGYQLVDVVTDDGFSAKDLSRPGIVQVLERLAQGEADALMVAKLDRLSRSVLDFAGLVERSRKEGWSLVCLDLGVDTSTASGEVMANVLAAFAQFERRLISERTKAALRVKRDQGVVLGRPRVLSPEREALVKELRSDGWTYSQIARLFNGRIPSGRGGRWWPSTVRAVCQRV